ncbi:MAG: tetratricopeptide repeat protein [Gemmatimonas sp.]
MSSPLDSLIEEVDEDLRRDRAVALMRKYGPYVIALALGVVISVAGVMVWRQYKAEREMERSTVYATALDAINRGDAEQATKLLGDVSSAGPASGYGVLARLQDAALKARAGDPSGAATIYDGIATDSRVDPLFRELSQILYALTAFDSTDPAQLAARIQPLADGNGPWRFSAKEIAGYLAVKTGDAARAKDLFAQIADDPRAPEEIRGRAAAMASTLGR